MTKRGSLRASLSLALPIVAVLAGANATQAADSVTYNLGWLPQGSQSGIFMAMERGYYAEEGLDVSVVRGYGTIRTTNEVDQGMFEFGYGHPLGVILNRDAGGQTRMIGTINANNPSGLCWVKGRHSIQEPADLKGLTAGGVGGAPVHVILPVWLTRNGMEPTDINLLQMDPGVIEASLLQGRIDLAECWLGSNMPILRALASAEGLELERIPYDKFNMDIYGAGLVTSEELIEERPDLVRRFVQATYRGYAEARQDPEGATDAILKQFPTLDWQQTLEQVQETSDLLVTPYTGQYGLGWQTEEKMERTHEFLSAAYDIDGISVEDTYTNDFLQ